MVLENEKLIYEAILAFIDNLEAVKKSKNVFSSFYKGVIVPWSCLKEENNKLNALRALLDKDEGNEHLIDKFLWLMHAEEEFEAKAWKTILKEYDFTKHVFMNKIYILPHEKYGLYGREFIKKYFEEEKLSAIIKKAYISNITPKEFKAIYNNVKSLNELERIIDSCETKTHPFKCLTDGDNYQCFFYSPHEIELVRVIDGFTYESIHRWLDNKWDKIHCPILKDPKLQYFANENLKGNEPIFCGETLIYKEFDFFGIKAKFKCCESHKTFFFTNEREKAIYFIRNSASGIKSKYLSN
ncbi:MAG: hypothetical protein PHS81_04565 [Candidatus Nanoarchaeia archaeon]|nr:hypothetical protein [Candidatus Nanoarchaeia archaeon]